MLTNRKRLQRSQRKEFRINLWGTPTLRVWMEDCRNRRKTWRRWCHGEQREEHASERKLWSPGLDVIIGWSNYRNEAFLLHLVLCVTVMLTGFWSQVGVGQENVDWGKLESPLANPDIGAIDATCHLPLHVPMHLPFQAGELVPWTKREPFISYLLCI